MVSLIEVTFLGAIWQDLAYLDLSKPLPVSYVSRFFHSVSFPAELFESASPLRPNVVASSKS